MSDSKRSDVGCACLVLLCIALYFFSLTVTP